MAYKKISNITEDKERGFYASRETFFDNIKIEGPADGESAFKESRDIQVCNSSFSLRYPFWHNTNVVVENSSFAPTARAAFWYDDNLTISNVIAKGVKAIRECKNIVIDNSSFESEEFCWRSRNINIEKSKISGFYAFFECRNIKINDIEFKGKYSFQYVENMEIVNSKLDTKDAFWHAKNVVVKDSDIIGEYLGWYSENLTLINCRIKGTQPLCYCKNLKLVDCTFDECDLAFEYSEVEGNILSDVISIKNPLIGQIILNGDTELIIDENDRSKGKFKLIRK